MSDFANNVNVLLSSDPSGAIGNWTRLPNGMLLQWGVMPVRQDGNDYVQFPQAFLSESVSVVVSGGVRVGTVNATENTTTVYAVYSTGFNTYTAENQNNFNATKQAWWMAMGF